MDWADGENVDWEHAQVERANRESEIKYARNSAGELVAIHPLPDLGKRERARKAGAQALSGMKSIFGAAPQ